MRDAMHVAWWSRKLAFDLFDSNTKESNESSEVSATPKSVLQSSAMVDLDVVKGARARRDTRAIPHLPLHSSRYTPS